MKKKTLKGILFSGTGSLWWGVIGVFYFKSVSFVSPLELTIHRTVWTAFLLIITTSLYSNWAAIFNIRKTSYHLEYMEIVKRSKKAVQTVLCTINSIGSTKDTDLKYKTPITPHHSEPIPLNRIP